MAFMAYLVDYQNFAPQLILTLKLKKNNNNLKPNN